MGSQQSTPSRRNPIRPRTLSRIFRPGHVANDHDHDAQPVRRASAPCPAPAPAQGQTQETETAQEETPPAPRPCASARQGHLGRDAHFVRRDGLDRAHEPLDQQAPTTSHAGPQTAQEGAPAPDRARCEAVAAASPPAREAAAAAAEGPRDVGRPAAVPVPVPVSLPGPVDPGGARAVHEPDVGSSRPEETPATPASTAPTAAPIPPELPAAELHHLDEQHPVLSSPSLTTSPFATAPSTPTPVSPSNPTPTPPAPPSPNSTSAIPRTLPLGTTMIVQGLVQTIEVPRVRTTAPTETTDNVMTPEVEPIRRGQASAHTKPSIDSGNPSSRASTTSAPSTSSTPTPSTSSGPSTEPTPTPSTTPPDTPPTPSSAASNTPLPSSPTPTSTPPARTNTTGSGSPPPPSSTDVLGLLLSIAAQATAEALVPWSVPPRSRNLGPSSSSGTGDNRNGIANGLAAAFSALAAGGARQTRTEESSPVAVEAPLAPTPVEMPIPTPRPRTRPAPTPRRLSTLSTGRRTSNISNRRASFVERIGEERDSDRTRRRAMSMLGDTVRRFMPWRSTSGPTPEGNEGSREEEAADFARAPPGGDISSRASADETQVPISPVERSPSVLLPPPPLPTPTSLAPPPPLTPPSASPPRATTDAEDLVRFSHMLGFTPGAVHPAGSFERFLADMQDELRTALSEYQERTRPRDVPRESRQGREDEATNPGSRLDHTRPHVPSTDPLPLNWWRMYRFEALPNVAVPASGTNAQSVTRGEVRERVVEGSGPPETPAVTPSMTNSPGMTADTQEGSTIMPSVIGDSSSASATAVGPSTSASVPVVEPEPPVPVHPAIIIGLRSVSRDSADEGATANAGGSGVGAASATASARRSAETRRRSPSSGAETEPRRSSMGDASWARRFGLREGEETEDSRRGTRNYIIWIIGGYYPSNHPLLAHPNLFLGQVHPDELWMLNEFLGQVKPPTASKDDIAKAGLRVIKGREIEEYAKDGGVTENCTERCLVCLDDYAEEEDLRIMSCKHMFHKDCVDRWMETGRNNCPACRSKGVDTTSSSPPASTAMAPQVS